MTSPFVPGVIHVARAGGVRVVFYVRIACADDPPTAIQRQLRVITAALSIEAPHPLTPTCHIGRCCCCAPSRSGSGGRPTTPPRNSPPPGHRPTKPVRQPAIKPRETGSSAGSSRNAGSPSTTWANTSVSPSPILTSGSPLVESSRSQVPPYAGICGEWRDGEQTSSVRQRPPAPVGSLAGSLPRA
jgi:hypothetical protein